MNDTPVRDNITTATQAGCAATRAEIGAISPPDAPTTAAELAEYAKNPEPVRTSKGYWSKFTPEQRSKIMRDRAAKARAYKVKPATERKERKPARSLGQIRAAAMHAALNRAWRYDLDQLQRRAKELRRSHLHAAAALETIINTIHQ